MPEFGFIFPNEAHPAWGIMIVLYPYITGLVAGAFVVSALYHVFGRQELKPVARLALVTSLCFCAFATLPLLLHLHHPERCLQILITPSATSAIAGFGFIYGAYMLLLVVEVWLVFRPSIVHRATTRSGVVRVFYLLLALGVTSISERARAVDKWLIRALAVAGIPIACLLHGYVGFLFGAVKANAWWSSSLMPVIFLASAIVSGMAALILLYRFSCWWRGVAVEVACLRALARYLWLFLVAAVTLEGLELLQMAYVAGGEWPSIYALLTKHLSISYGVIQILVGSILPLLLLLPSFHARLPSRSLSALSGLASLLILVQVFAMRWNVIVGGQLLSKSFRGFAEYPLYWSGREGLLAVIVVLALPLLALWGAARILPLWQDTPADDPGLAPRL